MEFKVLTLFPEQIRLNVESSITGRAWRRGLFNLDIFDIRDFAGNTYGKIDDSLYGGGIGMLMQAEPVYQAWLAAGGGAPPHRDAAGSSRTLYLSPKGRVLTQETVAELARESRLILLCGHYEGVDARVLEEISAEEVSVGDYVLTGGELPACMLIDAVCRLLPGVLPGSEVYENESHTDGRLEGRHFTKPPFWRGREVPAILQEGNHAKIERWRELDGLAETLWKRPDLFNRLKLDKTTYTELLQHLRERALLNDGSGTGIPIAPGQPDYSGANSRQIEERTHREQDGADKD